MKNIEEIRKELENLIETRDNLRSEVRHHNPANAEIKAKIEKTLQQIRILVAEKDAREEAGEK